MNEDEFFNGTMKGNQVSDTLIESKQVVTPKEYQEEYYIRIRNSEIRKVRTRAANLKERKSLNWKEILGALSGIFFGSYVGYALSIGKIVSDNTIFEKIGTTGMLILFSITTTAWFFVTKQDNDSAKDFATFILDTLIEEEQNEPG